MKFTDLVAWVLETHGTIAISAPDDNTLAISMTWHDREDMAL